MDKAISVAGITVNNLSRREAIERIVRMPERGKKQYVCFVNAEAVVLARRSKKFHQILTDASLRLVDGAGMQLAARIWGKHFVENCNGTDLFPELCKRLNEFGRSVFLLGGRPGRSQKTALFIQKNYARIKVLGTSHGYFTKVEEEEVIAGIRRLAPDVLLVGLGSPYQELWTWEHLNQLDAGVILNVGGLFDFYSGAVHRAPEWMRKTGIEWIWRILWDPRRWYRLVRLFEFIYIILIYKFIKR